MKIVYHRKYASFCLVITIYITESPSTKLGANPPVKRGTPGGVSFCLLLGVNILVLAVNKPGESQLNASPNANVEDFASKINNAPYPQVPMNLAVSNLKNDINALVQVYKNIKSEDKKQMFEEAVKGTLGEEEFKEFSTNIDPSWLEKTEGLNFIYGTGAGLYETGKSLVELLDTGRKAIGLVNPLDDDSVVEMNKAQEDLKNMGDGLIQAISHPLQTARSIILETKDRYNKSLSNGTIGYEMGKTYSGLLLTVLGGGAATKTIKELKELKVVGKTVRATSKIEKAKTAVFINNIALKGRIEDIIGKEVKRLEKAGVKINPTYSISIKVDEGAKTIELANVRFGKELQGAGLFNKVYQEVFLYASKTGCRITVDAVNPRIASSILKVGGDISWLEKGGSSGVHTLKDLINSAKQVGSRGWTDGITNVMLVVEP
ncbi:MAG: hypothetical protein NT030_00995 [Candidatus Saganbacteria bacterium]|nr:hypothetical protein [Candidatus Saganbacteria bacterium]